MMTSAFLLHSGDKDLEHIQQIFTFIEVVNLTKFVVRTIVDRTMMAKKKQPKRSDLTQNEKYFNCKKKAITLRIVAALLAIPPQI